MKTNRAYYARKGKEWAKEHPDRVREIARKSRRKNLPKDALKSKKYRERHRDEIKVKTKRKYQLNKSKILQNAKDEVIKLKTEVIKHYSNGSMKCNQCETKGLPFLNIDHIEGRKTIDHENFNSVRVYRYLIRNDFPKVVQVLCWNCNKVKEFERPRTYSTNADAVWNRKRHKEIKIEVFSHYSNGIPKCNCCGFSKLEGLSIDHKIGRKASGHSRRLLGHALYAWLKRNCYPTEYQVLCHNCNGAKSDRGICPHKSN